MKIKKPLAFLTALVMVLGIMPSIALAGENVTVDAARAMFFNNASECKSTDGDNILVASNGSDGWQCAKEFTDEDATVTSQATNLAGTGFATPRNAFVAFTLPDIDYDNLVSATLSLTVKNVKQVTSGERIAVYGNSLKGSWEVGTDARDALGFDGPSELGLEMLGFTTAIQAGNQTGETASNETITLSSKKLISYLKQLKADGYTEVTFRLANSLGGIRIYDADQTNKPTLTLETGEVAEVTLKTIFPNGDTQTKTIGGLLSGDAYTPSDNDAPVVAYANGDIYLRDKLEPLILVAGSNEYTVTYTKSSILSVAAPTGTFSVLAGDEPMLPASIDATMADGATVVPVEAEWSTKDDITAAGTVTYTARVTGYTGEAAEVSVEVLPCDNSVDTFYSAGASDGAGFSWYNYLGYKYAVGEAVFDTTFVINEGTNKLISFGNSSTSSFGGAGALLRYMNVSNFEYYNGSWKESAVKCETGKTYRLRTVVSFANHTYRMYITDEDGVTSEVTSGDAAFRNSGLDSIDRMFFHGSGDAGEKDGVILSQRSYWKDGYVDFTAQAKCGDKLLGYKDETKWAEGTPYTADNAPKAIYEGGKIYVLGDVNSVPTTDFNVTADQNSFDIEYNEVTASIRPVNDVNVVEGDTPVLPSTATVEFSDGQTLDYDITWDMSGFDSAKGGTVEGTTELGLTVSCVVNVKSLNVIPYEEGKTTVVTNNGGWNWYVEPSGTHIQPGDSFANLYEGKTVDINGDPITYESNRGYTFQHDKTYMGWVEDGGDIVVSELDHDTGEYKRVVIHEKLESDDHNNPAVVVLPDGRIMAVYSMHTNESYMYMRVTKNPEDISEWNPEQYYHCQSVTPDDTDVYNATYPTVFMVHDDPTSGTDAIYMGWRGVHWKPTLAKFPMPDENGVFPEDETGSIDPIMHQTQFANTTYGYSTYDGADAPNAKSDGGKTDSGRRPYTKYDYDYERNMIYITFTANHPDNDKRNHIFYVQLNIEDQNLYTAGGTFLQPLPFENQQTYKTQGAVLNGSNTNGQWGVLTADLYEAYPDLVVFNASEQTGASFNPRNGDAERRGWTWDIAHNEKGEPCIVYVDVTATPPGENGSLPSWYYSSNGDEGASRAHHYYWYARWDSESGQWVKTFLAYGGKWWHQNYGQERCYSGGLTFDHNYPGNAIFLSIPTYGKYGNMHEIYRWVSDDDGATWTTREAITQDSKTPNARPNAIYNYKMDPETGENLGPRLLWKTGEYRYWMNYEYKTGVMTDYADADFLTQDDPEMFADADLYNGSEKVDVLPVGDNTLTAKFVVSNISIGDGEAMFALAHYSEDGKLKNVITRKETIPARSVPQIGVVGAPKQTDDGSASPWASNDNLSTMGDPEVIIEIPYEASIEEGDRIALFAWDNGLEKAMESIISIPYVATTEANSYLMRETFTYDGTSKLILDQDENTFNGWTGKGYNSSGSVDFIDNDVALGSSYAAITKSVFANTGLHLFRTGGEGIMASHALPDTNGKDYTIEFTVRYINEQSWNDTDNAGFTLSHGVPTAKGDSTNSASAFQFRHGVKWADENGRGTYGYVRDTTAFDGGSESQIFHGGISRTIDTTDMIEGTYDKGVEYYDPKTETYIHDYNDSLMVGSLYRFKITVHPALEQLEMTINDGYRTVEHVATFNSGYDWDANPIDTITFSIGSEKWGEMYIDDLSVKLAGEGQTSKTVDIARADGGALTLGSGQFTVIQLRGGECVFLDRSDGKSIDVSGQSTSVGSSVGTYEYNGGDNQKFYIEETEGGYLIKGKQSGIYLGVSDSGAVTLQEKTNATVFTLTEVEEDQAMLEEFLAQYDLQF